MDTTAPGERFEHAARFDSELSERQHEVLRLIAEGKTNAEIAEALGMTLAGAKWHVSEVLTKLALPSREAAGEYYRWRQSPRRRAARFIRGVAPVAWWKYGVGGASVAAAGTAAFGFINALHGSNPEDVGPTTPGRPFMMESTFTRTTDHTAVEARRWYWYESESRMRTDIGSATVTHADAGYETGFEQGPGITTILVEQGQRTFSSSWSYSVNPYPAYTAVAPGSAATLGPLPYSSIDEAIINLSGGDSTNSPIESRRLGERSIAGVTVEGVEFVVHKDDPGTFSSIYWIDPKRMLILKRETSYSPGGSSPNEIVREVEVATRLSYGRVDESKFAVSPLPGATVVKCPAVGRAQSQGQFTTPFVAIPQNVLPVGLRALSWGVSADRDGNCESAVANYVDGSDPEGPIVLFLNEYVTIPDSFFVDVTWLSSEGGNIATRSDGAGNHYLRFVAHDVAIELRFDTLAEDSVLSIARAMME